MGKLKKKIYKDLRKKKAEIDEEEQKNKEEFMKEIGLDLNHL